MAFSFILHTYKRWWQGYKKENDGTIRENDSRHDFDQKMNKNWSLVNRFWAKWNIILSVIQQHLLIPRPIRTVSYLLSCVCPVLHTVCMDEWSIYLCCSSSLLFLLLFVCIWSSAKAAGVCIALSVWYVGCEILVPAIRYCEYNISPFFFRTRTASTVL